MSGEACERCGCSATHWIVGQEPTCCDCEHEGERYADEVGCEREVRS